MKHWLSGLLAALMLFSLTACGGVMDLTEVSSGDESPRLEEETAGLPSGEEEESPEAPGGPEEAEEPDAGPFSITEDPETGDLTLSGAGSNESNSDLEECWVFEDGSYTTKEDVACYIHFYGRLPGNFITKREAQNLGWTGGALEPYAPGQNLCIGGSRLGNDEGLLPDAEGRTWTECDIDTLGARSRGAKRIVFSNDGLIYYTGDHYESFELLYGDESDD